MCSIFIASSFYAFPDPVSCSQTVLNTPPFLSLSYSKSPRININHGLKSCLLVKSQSSIWETVLHLSPPVKNVPALSFHFLPLSVHVIQSKTDQPPKLHNKKLFCTLENIGMYSKSVSKVILLRRE